MQPVTIKNNQFTNTLWLTQVVLGLMLLLIIGLGLFIDYKLLLVLPVIFGALWLNQKTISHQQNFQFKFNTSGKMLLLPDKNTNSAVDNELVIKGYWQIPHALMIKLSHLQNKKHIHLTVFRSVIGEKIFSNLWVGLNQANVKLNEYHES